MVNQQVKTEEFQPKGNFKYFWEGFFGSPVILIEAHVLLRFS